MFTMDPVFRDDVEELLGEQGRVLVEMFEQDGLLEADQVLVRTKEQLMEWYEMSDELMDGLLEGLREKRAKRKKGKFECIFSLTQHR